MSRRTRYLTPLMLSTALILTGVVTASARPSPQADADDANIARADVGLLDRFLDTHPAISQALEKNPSLVYNPQYVASQPALQAFLQDHPGIREQLRTNPQAMMKDLVRLDGATRADALTRGEFNSVDSYLDAHPSIARQLHADPSLIRSRNFVKNNPSLLDFLQSNRDLARDWRSNPQAAMNGLAAVDASQATGPVSTDSLSRGELSAFDSFMDAHPAISSQLKSNPSLINDRAYLNDHPELVTFLENNPGVQEDWRENPQAAMKQLATTDAAQAKPHSSSSDLLSRGQAEALDSFMDTHLAIAKQLQANPSLINSRDYVSDHPELAAFLQNHPDLAEDWRSNPHMGMNSLSRMDASPASFSRGQVSALDAFLDAHGKIAGELDRTPSLINDRAYIANHPELAGFLEDHPDLAQQWRNYPQLAMTNVSSLDVSQRQLTRENVAALDAFLDTHAQISSEIGKNPALVGNRNYVSNHPELAAFLEDHPYLASAWRNNPQAAMSDLSRYDAATAPKAAAPPAPNEDALGSRQTTGLDAFLDAHPTLGDQLQSNPSLINNRDFLSDHPELGAFLQAHPDVAEDWRSNPQAAMNGISRMDALQARTANANTTTEGVAKFDAFLDNHATISEELRAHPTMVNESAYLKANPELKAFLANNPGVVAQLKANPALLMRGVQKLDTHAAATAPKHGAEVPGAGSIHK